MVKKKTTTPKKRTSTKVAGRRSQGARARQHAPKKKC